MVPTDPQADENGSAFTGAAFYSDRTEFQSQTSFDVTRALQEGTKENRIILRHIRNIAAQIKRLEQAGVPILWRPLHEASGQWFWWGAKGAHPYKKLWISCFTNWRTSISAETLSGCGTASRRNGWWTKTPWISAARISIPASASTRLIRIGLTYVPAAWAPIA